MARATRAYTHTRVASRDEKTSVGYGHIDVPYTHAMTHMGTHPHTGGEQR